mmetsp:Transcript_37264/g.115996  ORF Transcript_37264/g.115996 Transcript_37264/m.115996 type:complete len:257 (+) Transcript_37264:88-858(+)
MIKALSHALALGMAAAAAPAFNFTGRCKVGLTFSGLGPELSGDFIGDGNAFGRFTDSPKAEYSLGFTWKNPERPGQGGWGCEFWPCSAEDKALAAGKWAIAARTDFARADMRVLAVCEEGCPDFKPSCGALFNQPPDAPDLIYCPIWPQAWSKPMKWKIVASETGKVPEPTVVASTGSCCRRKPMECDACHKGTCEGLIGLLHNNCPPNNGSILHWQSKLQSHCCEISRPPPIELPVCGCKIVETECDHSEESLLV